jgi:hypothetical protein
MISPAPLMIKSIDWFINLPSIYGRTAIKARKLHPKRFSLFDTFVKKSAVSAPGLIPGIYPHLF